MVAWCCSLRGGNRDTAVSVTLPLFVYSSQVLQEKLRWCYHKEGVNHYEVCKDLAVSYLELLKVRGGWWWWMTCCCAVLPLPPARS